MQITQISIGRKKPGPEEFGNRSMFVTITLEDGDTAERLIQESQKFLKYYLADTKEEREKIGKPALSEKIYVNPIALNHNGGAIEGISTEEINE